MMDSEQPTLGMPFGYCVDPASNNHLYNNDNVNQHPYSLPPSPPMPAGGSALLDSTEINGLISFLDNVESNNYNFNPYMPPMADHHDTAPNWNSNGWMGTTPPPAFVGTASSYGLRPQLQQQHLAYPITMDPPLQDMNIPLPTLPHHDGSPQMPSLSLHDGPLGMHPTMLAAVSQAPTADVLGAATALQNGSSHHPFTMNNMMFHGQHMSVNPLDSQVVQGLGLYNAAQQNHSHESGRGDASMRDDYYTQMVFEPVSNEAIPARSRPFTQKANDVRFGSDAAFGAPQGCFVASVSQARLWAREQSMMQTVDGAFVPVSSSNSLYSTPGSSPVLPAPNSLHRPDAAPDHDEVAESRPRKRQKGKGPGDGAADHDAVAVATAPRSRPVPPKKRKPNKPAAPAAPAAIRSPSAVTAADSEPSSSTSKRRKSPPSGKDGAAKPVRQNLTEAQKRGNHIRSEQKRRTVIRQGYTDLCDLVPALRVGDFSRSAQLSVAADWLEDLLRGNEGLRTTLQSLQR